MAHRPNAGRIAVAIAALAVVSLVSVRPSAAQVPVDDFVDACRPGSDNPYLATTVFMRGRSQEDGPSVLAFRNTDDNSDQHLLAAAADVGAVYGLAYHGRDEVLYAGAFHKRGTHFGPAGAGAIYALHLRTGDVRVFAIVPDAGGDTHDPSGDYFPDQPARFMTTRVSLGDLELKDDGTELYVTNLFNRRVYAFSVPDGRLLGGFDHGAASEDWAEDARVFGLGYRDGWLYHGVVRTAESSQDRDELEARVYESKPDGSRMRLVASSPIAFERGWVWPGTGRAIWNPWRDPPGQLSSTGGRFPMPILADIDFSPAGHIMVLGFRDRFGDQTFYTTPPNQPPPGEQIHNTPAGDILPAFPANDLWHVQTLPEYFSGDYGPNERGNHDETSYGGVAVIPWLQTVVMSANSPLVISSAGGVWLDLASGRDTAREQVYVYNPRFPSFGKANGLGDVELLCNTLTESTPTPSATASTTPTATATDTPTATASSTATPSPTVTRTPTVTPTRTATATASRTPSPTVTPTGTVPTATITSTPGPTATPGKVRTPEDTPKPPTPELPRLPRTGGGGAARLPTRP